MRGAQRRGFTLLEIVIAIVILVVGITGIVAIFPTAIKSGNKTVIDSYASVITQSVVDAVNVGLREARYQTTDAPNEQWEYFIFQPGSRDRPYGVLNDLDGANVVPELYDRVFDKDFCVLLPQGPATNNVSAAEIVLHFPNPHGAGGGSVGSDPRRFPDYGNISNLSNERLPPNGDDRRRTVSDPNGSGIFEVRRAYFLGRDLTTGNVGEDFLGEQVNAERLIEDPFPQYSYAFSLQRARVDTGRAGDATRPDGQLSAIDYYSDSLFEIKVKVFRNFNPDGITNGAGEFVPRTNEWIHEFVTLISK